MPIRNWPPSSCSIISRCSARELPFDLPRDLKPGDPPRTIAIEIPGGRRVLPESRAPDGYELETRSQRGGGLVGDIFGMNRYNQDTVLVNRGRAHLNRAALPYRYQSPMSVVGWIATTEDADGLLEPAT